MIIGAPKSVKDFPVLKKEEVEMLVKTLAELLAQGLPAEAPMGVPMGSLAQLVHTALGAFAEEAPVEPAARLILPPFEKGEA
jgi:hypothetical protein